ncbi:unnamed protein product, partial [Porites lobata]
LNTQFLLPCFEEKKLFPRFYGKELDKLKVYDALKKDMHVEVRTKWGELKCHCSRIPILRLSKTARNLNKVFLTCGTPASAATRCKYFQWIHTPLFIDKRPLQKLKYATNLAKKQEEQRKAQTKYPWKSTPLPSTFHWSPEISKELKKQACQANKHDEWKPPPGAEKYEKNE